MVHRHCVGHSKRIDASSAVDSESFVFFSFLDIFVRSRDFGAAKASYTLRLSLEATRVSALGQLKTGNKLQTPSRGVFSDTKNSFFHARYSCSFVLPLTFERDWSSPILTRALVFALFPRSKWIEPSLHAQWPIPSRVLLSPSCSTKNRASWDFYGPGLTDEAGMMRWNYVHSPIPTGMQVVTKWIFE